MELGNTMPVAAGHPLLRRRDFLVMGSAGLAALCLGDLVWAEPLPAGAAFPLPVAYLEGSAQTRDLKHLPRDVRRPGTADKAVVHQSLAVVAADRVPLGDTSLVGRPLRLRIHGLYPPAALTPKRRRELPLAIDLDVIFPPPDPTLPAPAPFHAWSFRNGQAWNCSPPVSFVFPLDWYVYPELSMRVVPAGGGSALTMTTRFTLDDEPGLPRLQRGLYLLGLQPGSWRAEGEIEKLGGRTPAELFSILISIEPEGEEP
jgi:hypothetical protein